MFSKEKNYLFLLALLLNIALPVKDAAELNDVRVSELDQFFGCLFAAATATAVHHNELVFVG